MSCSNSAHIQRRGSTFGSDRVCGMMELSEYVARRNAYSYPAVALGGRLDSWREVSFSSTRQLDCHQNSLLLSGENERTVLGYLSTIYWGYYSGKDQAKRSERARGRVRLALDGKDRKNSGRMRGVTDRGIDFVAQQIRTAFDSLMSDKYTEALELLCDLPQLELAFASKVCAFLAPEKCGVIDKVIARKYPCFGFSVHPDGRVKNTGSNRDSYAVYCSFLQKQAGELNLDGQQFLWRDRDNLCHAWRALDVERSLY